MGSAAAEGVKPPGARFRSDTMTAFGWFQPSVLGMTGQSRALEVISGNIANVTTTAYKRTESDFQTLLSRSWAGPSAAAGNAPVTFQSDIAGVAAIDRLRASDPGAIKGTGRDLDLAINGDGFFVLDDGAGGSVYSRDGAFTIAPVSDPTAATGAESAGYLVDGSGRALQGWAYTGAAAGAAAGGALGPMRVDSGAFADDGEPTTLAALGLNLPASDSAGSSRTYAMGILDSARMPHTLDLTFTKAQQPNTWSLAVSADPGAGITITPPSTDTGAPAGSGQALSFDGSGSLTAPPRYTIGVTHADGATSSFELDVSRLTQLAGDFAVSSFEQNGRVAGALSAISFDAEGHVVGVFENGFSRPLYTIALADFASPDGLDPLSGNVFAASAASGAPSVGQAGENGLGEITPSALELSNVSLEDEFSRMIVTQSAYNSSATAFRTMDEMTETARDLKG
jgi:flagellar hook protein FlgE